MVPALFSFMYFLQGLFACQLRHGDKIGRLAMGLAILSLSLFTVLAEAQLYSIKNVQEQLSAGRLNSVDQAITMLSPMMRKYVGVVYQGQSSQPSSVTRPRLIFSDRSGFFAAATTNEKHFSYNRIEFAQLNEKTKEIELYLLDFNKPNPSLQKDPKECMVCHKINGRIHLRFESYPYWPGWFGVAGRSSLLDQMIGQSEKEKIHQFFQEKGSISRLENLIDSENEQDFILRSHERMTRLTFLVARAQGEGLFHAIKNHPEFAQLQLALTISMYDSDPKRLADSMPISLYEAYINEYEKINNEITKQNKTYGEFLNTLFLNINKFQMAANTDKNYFIPYYLENNKFSALVFLEWFLRRNKDSLKRYSSSGLYGNYYVNDGLDGISDGVFINLLKSVSRQSGILLPVPVEAGANFEGLPLQVMSLQRGHESLMRHFFQQAKGRLKPMMMDCKNSLKL